jgi:hypothetical protein
MCEALHLEGGPLAEVGFAILPAVSLLEELMQYEGTHPISEAVISIRLRIRTDLETTDRVIVGFLDGSIGVATQLTEGDTIHVLMEE